MKSILTNTVKITVAAVLAILCAQALKLDFAVSAGIVAILSVQPTKKETLSTALARLLAFARKIFVFKSCKAVGSGPKHLNFAHSSFGKVKSIIPSGTEPPL